MSIVPCPKSVRKILCPYNQRIEIRVDSGGALVSCQSIGEHARKGEGEEASCWLSQVGKQPGNGCRFTRNHGMAER